MSLLKLLVYYAILSSSYAILVLAWPEAGRALTIFFTSLLLIPAVAWEFAHVSRRRGHEDA